MNKLVGSLPLWQFILVVVGVLIVYSVIAGWADQKMAAQKMAKQQQAAAQQQQQQLVAAATQTATQTATA